MYTYTYVYIHKIVCIHIFSFSVNTQTINKVFDKIVITKNQVVDSSEH